MDKKTFVTKQLVEEIAKDFPTPYHIYDEAGIRQRARDLQKAFAWNRGFKEYFAIKATPNPFILKIFLEEGCGLDCSSYTELLMADALGIKGDDIMFSSNETPDEDFDLVMQMGGIINLDDISHIDILKERYGQLPKRISCRINPGGFFKISNDIMDSPQDAKYGMTIEQVKEAFVRLKEEGVEEFGLHAFLASNTITNDYYPTLAKLLFELALTLYEETGVATSFINLSGGVGIAYRPEENDNDIFEIGRKVKEVYEEVLGSSKLNHIAIYTELGRFMTGPFGALVTKAFRYKDTYKHYIGVDACAANLMRPAMYGSYHHITVLGKEDEPKEMVYDVVGGLCENNDKFAIDRDLPKIDMGDYLVIHDTGAHGYAMGYNYNGKLKSAELLLTEDGKVKLIRRAESVKDYFATFDCFDILGDLVK